jgi:hypothetical protein
MKNYLIGTLAAIILLLASILYKNSLTTDGTFPIQEETKTRAGEVEVPMFLYIFASKRNCQDCMEVINVLNDLPPQFIVTGIVPKRELENEKEFRAITGAAFPLESSAKYKKLLPWYVPTIIGVSPTGKVLFTLPGVPGETAYLKNFLDSLYGKIYPVFLQDNSPGNSP